MAEAIKLKLFNPRTDYDISGEVVGVIFVDDMGGKLTAIRLQMTEEVEELIPKSFKFMSKWGAPVSNYQEAKLTLNDVLDNGFLTIQSSPQDAPSGTNNSGSSISEAFSQDESKSRSLKRLTISTSSQAQGKGQDMVNKELANDKCATKKSRRSTNLTQTTLTGYFGASSTPERKYTAAATRKGVHIYTEREINNSVGYEKERRLFWNNKAEELCHLQSYNRCSADEVDKLLHEHWKIYKADLLKREDMETTQKIQAIHGKYPNLESVVLTSARKVKKETVERNLVRVDNAKEALEKSRQKLDKLYASQKDKITLDLKKQIEAKEELHKYKYRELSKAEDALRQTLDIKKSLLDELLTRK